MTCRTNDWRIASAEERLLQPPSDMGMSQSTIRDRVTSDEVTLCPESLAVALPYVPKNIYRVLTLTMRRSQT